MSTHTFEVQVGRDTRNSRGSYKTRYKFTSSTSVSSQALLYYHSINLGNGYKKRLLKDGKVIDRQFSV